MKHLPMVEIKDDCETISPVRARNFSQFFYQTMCAIYQSIDEPIIKTSDREDNRCR